MTSRVRLLLLTAGLGLALWLWPLPPRGDEPVVIAPIEFIDGEDGSFEYQQVDEAEADIDSLAEKYLGQSPYPWRQPGEQRVSFVIEPTHVYHQDYS